MTDDGRDEPRPNGLDDVNSLEATAEYLKVAPRALADLVRRHGIAFLKTGRTMTFTRTAVLDYIKENESPALGGWNPHGLTRVE